MKKTFDDYFLELEELDKEELNGSVGRLTCAYRKDYIIEEYFGGSNKYISFLNKKLIATSKNGNIKLALSLINKGADSWCDSLDHAVAYNQFDMVKFLIDQHAFKKEDMNSAMGIAAAGGFINIVHFLIDQGADDWNIGLKHSVVGDQLELAKEFINLGATNLDEVEQFASVEIYDFLRKEWFTHELINAAKEGHLLSCEVIMHDCILHGVNLNHAMLGATLNNRSDVVDFLIKSGADWFEHGLCLAAEKGNETLVNLFIDKGANDWNDALENAIMGNQFEMVKFFIHKGANNLLQAINFINFAETDYKIVKLLSGCILIAHSDNLRVIRSIKQMHNSYARCQLDIIKVLKNNDSVEYLEGAFATLKYIQSVSSLNQRYRPTIEFKIDMINRSLNKLNIQ